MPNNVALNRSVQPDFSQRQTVACAITRRRTANIFNAANDILSFVQQHTRCDSC